MSDEPRHWFESAADHMGSAYLRYSFTRGTDQEIAFLVETLGLEPGMRVLDVGCGPGRHAHALATRGIAVHGIDISHRFVELARAMAPPGATFDRLDARALTFDSEFDAAISLCQGAFGLAALPGSPVPVVDPDGEILAAMARAVRLDGLVAVSAFSSYYQIPALDDPGSFAVDHGVNHERTELRSETGAVTEHDLWTSCFTPRELRLMARLAGLDVLHLWSVTPGRYAPRAPSLREPEFLLVARRA